MKISKIAVLLLMLLISSTVCMAEEEIAEEKEVYEYEDYEYYINEDGTVTISSWDGEDTWKTWLEVPAEIEGREVTEIGNFAFIKPANKKSRGN